MATTTIRIVHEDKAITSFVREVFEYAEYDVSWHEVPIVSDTWMETDARTRIESEASARGVPRGMLDKQAHHPRWYGLPYLVRTDQPPVKLLDGPLQGAWSDGKARFSMPRDGDSTPGSEAVYKIKYEFPDGGQPIWHDTLVPALDLLAKQRIQEVPLALLRRVINERNRRERHGSR